MGTEWAFAQNAAPEPTLLDRVLTAGRRVIAVGKIGDIFAHRGMSEGEAYKALRQMAMNQNRRLVDVADAVLSLADVLPGGTR